ncbi:MAG: hypothetical protein HY904_23345 [Deltaproteobacteria bacterium]|nr:hypothetical protein [Deltaproteobacteria bacterium]
MTLRGLGNNNNNLAAAASAMIQSGRNPADVLAQMGLIKLEWGLSPDDVMKQLLDFLVLKGFMPKADGAKRGDAPAGDAAKLAEALKQLQGKEGLPQSGRLDDKTSKVLVEKYRPEPSAAPPPPPATPKAPVSAQKQDASRFIRTASENAAARNLFSKTAEPFTPPQRSMSRPESPAAAQASAAAKAPPTPAAPATSTAAATTASTSTSTAAPPPTTAPPTTPSTPAPTTTAAHAPSTPAPASNSSSGAPTQAPGTPSQAPPSNNSSNTAAQSASSGPGKPGEGSAQARESQARPGSAGTGTQEAQEGGRAPDAPGLARGDATQQLGHQDGDGNQASGDENREDKRRGGALVDDGSGADEGAYEIPSMEEQLRKALKDIRKELDPDPNKPTTYQAEFVLYKPGFYVSGTQAPMVLNLKVDRATPYDEVWMEALEAVNRRIKLYDPESWPLTVDDIYSALQRARVKDD